MYMERPDSPRGESMQNESRKQTVQQSTNDLKTKLSKASSLEAFLDENEDSFVTLDFISALNRIFKEKGISKAALAKKAGVSDVFLYQIFSGKRKPSRNRLLCLCIGMNTSLEECQDLLRRNKNAPLYTRSRRDAVIEYGILHQMSLYEINERLSKAVEETLF